MIRYITKEYEKPIHQIQNNFLSYTVILIKFSVFVHKCTTLIQLRVLYICKVCVSVNCKTYKFQISKKKDMKNEM